MQFFMLGAQLPLSNISLFFCNLSWLQKSSMNLFSKKKKILDNFKIQLIVYQILVAFVLK